MKTILLFVALLFIVFSGKPQSTILSRQTDSLRRSAAIQNLSLPGKKIDYSWSGDHWAINDTTYYTYDPNSGKLLIEQFAPLYRKRYAYDSLGRQVSSIEETLINNRWQPAYKDSITFSPQNLELSNERYTYINDSWDLYSGLKIIPSYDSLGRLTSLTRQSFTSPSYKSFDKEVYEYAQDSLVAIYLYAWKDSSWNLQYRWVDLTPRTTESSFNYNNSLNNFTSLTVQYFINGTWTDVQYYKIDYPDDFGSFNQSVYDTSGIEIINSFFLRNSQNELLIESNKGWFNGKFTLLSYDSTAQYFSGQDLVAEVLWDYPTGIEPPVNKFDSACYSDFIHMTIDGISRQEKSMLNILVYPQPTEGLLHISFTEQVTSLCRFISPLGHTLQTIPIKNKDSIDVSGYPPGVYFLEFVFQEETIVKKIMIE